MGGTHLHRPQSIFQHTMSHQNLSQQNEAQWLRMPQVSSISMQWSIPSVEQPDLVRFTGQRPPEAFKRLIHYKRKMETPDVIDTQPNKQFITEEKMAQHFQGLHISANTFTAQESESANAALSNRQKLNTPNDIDFNLPNSVELAESNVERRLVISEEIKRIHEEPLLPKSLLSKLERPSMALVLWEPPSKHLRILPTLRDRPTSIRSSHGNNNGLNSNNISSNFNNSSNNNNNNNDSIPNLNQTMNFNVSDSNLEPMDL